MTVLVSGGFDPLHIGHIHYLESAGEYGYVVVALNSDPWLMLKKRYVFMPWKDRAFLLGKYPFVSKVISFNDDDGTVCDALEKIEPDYFANGGDRIEPNPKEHNTCVRLGIRELFNIGGEKIRSSSELTKSAYDYYKNSLQN